MRQNYTHRIILQSPDSAESGARIPVFEMTSSLPGPTVLITGGIDGDEYTGIRAAYDLMEYYTAHPVAGRIIIIPIVNIHGFLAKQSQNPRDGKFPKHIYPGKKNGTSTERIVHWLDTKYVQCAHLWIDLHSGSLTEQLTPFVWAYETKNREVNEKTISMIKTIRARITIYEKVGSFSKQASLAKRGTNYLLFECGQRGEQNPKEIRLLSTWVKKAVLSYQTDVTNVKPLKSLSRVQITSVPYDGLWNSNIPLGKIRKGSVAGVTQRLGDQKKSEVIAKHDGEVLWLASSLVVKKYDDLFAIGTDIIRI